MTKKATQVYTPYQIEETIGAISFPKGWDMVAVMANKGVHAFPDQDRLLGLRTLDKPTEFVAPAPGLICAGAKDRPPITGNVRRGALPIAQLGPAPGEAVLRAGVSDLEADVSLEELIQLRSRLLADAIGKP